jgi:hypothetical protein
MATNVRTLEFSILASGAVTAPSSLWAGYEGEHIATRLHFTVHASWAGYSFYLGFTNARHESVRSASFSGLDFAYDVESRLTTPPKTNARLIAVLAIDGQDTQKRVLWQGDLLFTPISYPTTLLDDHTYDQMAGFESLVRQLQIDFDSIEEGVTGPPTGTSRSAGRARPAGEPGAPGCQGRDRSGWATRSAGRPRGRGE